MPFGEDVTVNRSSADKYGVSDSVRQRFTGYQKDEETKLDFAEARMYNNQHGRFTAVDPLLASGKTIDPQTLNRYSYVTNRPLMYTDPSGMQMGSHSGAAAPAPAPLPPPPPIPQPVQPLPPEFSPQPPLSVPPAPLLPPAANPAPFWAAAGVTATVVLGEVMIFNQSMGANDTAADIEADAERQREWRRGMAFINFWEKGDVLNGLIMQHRHVTVTVQVYSGGVKTTGQVGFSGGTMIMDQSGLPDPKTGWQVELPDALSAIEFQNSEIERTLAKSDPPYDKNTNSCTHHVADVLRHGGLPIPFGTTRELYRSIKGAGLIPR